MQSTGLSSTLHSAYDPSIGQLMFSVLTILVFPTTCGRHGRNDAVDRLVLDTALVADNPWTVAGRTPVERIVAQRESARAVAFAKVRAHNVTKNKDNSTGISNGKRKSRGASSQGTIKGTGKTGSTGKAKGDVSDSEVR